MLDRTIVQRFNSAKNFIPPAYSISNLREGINFYIPIIQAFIKKYEITDILFHCMPEFFQGDNSLSHM